MISLSEIPQLPVLGGGVQSHSPCSHVCIKHTFPRPESSILMPTLTAYPKSYPSLHPPWSSSGRNSWFVPLQLTCNPLTNFHVIGNCRMARRKVPRIRSRYHISKSWLVSHQSISDTTSFLSERKELIYLPTTPSTSSVPPSICKKRLSNR